MKNLIQQFTAVNAHRAFTCANPTRSGCKLRGWQKASLTLRLMLREIQPTSNSLCRRKGLKLGLRPRPKWTTSHGFASSDDDEDGDGEEDAPFILDEDYERFPMLAELRNLVLKKQAEAS